MTGLVDNDENGVLECVEKSRWLMAYGRYEEGRVDQSCLCYQPYAISS